MTTKSYDVKISIILTFEAKNKSEIEDNWKQLFVEYGLNISDLLDEVELESIEEC